MSAELLAGKNDSGREVKEIMRFTVYYALERTPEEHDESRIGYREYARLSLALRRRLT